MGRYIAGRAVEALPLLLLVSIILFAIIQLTGDPLAAYTVDSTLTGEDLIRLRHYYGLDQPVPIQYVRWLGNVLTTGVRLSSATCRSRSWSLSVCQIRCCWSPARTR